MSVQGVREAFDRLAPSYDLEFTGSIIGGLQREAVWDRLGGVFGPGDRLLDLGCGTGEDAVGLARQGVRVDGIDLSPEMIHEAELRVQSEGLDDLVRLRRLPLERLDQADPGPYDGAYSNFGPLNCVQDLRPVARALAERIRPGGTVALCLMSRFCLWETLFYPLTLQIHKAIRRWSGHWAEASVDEQDRFRVYYPSIVELRRTFAPEFEFVAAAGIGILLPPTYLEPLAQRRPGLIRWFARVDRILRDLPLLRSIADHRLVIFRRVELG